MRRRRQSAQPMTAINLTSLLDITFVLLIAFMIVAPSLKHGLEIELPQTEEVDPLPQQDPVVVAIARRKDAEDLPYIMLGPDRVDLKELEERLQNQHTRNPKMSVLIECDQREESGILVQVIDAVQRAGLENVGIQTELR